MEKEKSYDIIISKRAEENLDKILSYLKSEWNESVKNSFLEKFKKLLSLLSVNPYMCQIFSEKRKIRRCLITKQNALYYRIADNTVQIITIHDTRRNPNTLKHNL